MARHMVSAQGPIAYKALHCNSRRENIHQCWNSDSSQHKSLVLLGITNEVEYKFCSHLLSWLLFCFDDANSQEND